jgi:hypothetical protein
LFEGIDRDSAEKMQQLFGSGSKKGAVLTMAKVEGIVNRLLTKGKSGNAASREVLYFLW